MCTTARGYTVDGALIVHNIILYFLTNIHKHALFLAASLCVASVVWQVIYELDSTSYCRMSNDKSALRSGQQKWPEALLLRYPTALLPKPCQIMIRAQLQTIPRHLSVGSLQVLRARLPCFQTSSDIFLSLWLSTVTGCFMTLKQAYSNNK